MIFCSWLCGHFVEHEKDQKGGKPEEEVEEERDYPVYVNLPQLDLAV